MKLQPLTTDQIRDKVKSRQPFWVGSKNERKQVATISAAQEAGFKTSSDGNGGFNCYIPPTIKRK